MKTVGILTFHFTENYGATLQAYALWQVLNQQGYKVEFIDYRPRKLIQAYIKHLYTNHRRPLSNLDNAVKSWKMRRFLLSRMQVSKQKFYSNSKLHGFSHYYDAVICGSDEIWNIDSPFLGLDLAYFLDFISSQHTQKISYAPSFGSTKTLGICRESISRSLKDFSAISVRDTNSLKLLNDECGVSATRVLDPTLLVNYEEVLKSPKSRDNYVLVYGGFGRIESAYIKAVADMAGLKIISVGYPFRYADKTLVGVGPDEWLGYFAQAKYIFTTFFHGTIFSIIFRKPFAVFDRTDKSIKVRDLLGELRLEDRILTEATISSSEPKLPMELTFDQDKLNEMIQHSRAYLDEALKSNS